MHRKLEVITGKTLKLNNALLYPLLDKDESEVINFMDKIEMYVRNKGNLIVGPLFQSVEITGDDFDINMYLIVQTKTPIHQVDPSYLTRNQIVVRNCLYVRFCGEEKYIKARCSLRETVILTG